MRYKNKGEKMELREKISQKIALEKESWHKGEHQRMSRKKIVLKKVMKIINPK